MNAPDINFPFEEGKTYVFNLENGNTITGVYRKTNRTLIEENELVEIEFHLAAENGFTFLSHHREFELWNYNEEGKQVNYVYVNSIFGEGSRLLGFQELDLSGKDFFELGRITPQQTKARNKLLRDQNVDYQREDTSHTIGTAEVVVVDDEGDSYIVVMVKYDGQMFPRNEENDFFHNSLVGIYRSEEKLQDAILDEDIGNEPMVITISPTGQITYYKKSTFTRLITIRNHGRNVFNLAATDPFTRIPLSQFYIMPWTNDLSRSERAEHLRAKHSHEGAALGGTLKKRRRRRNTRRRY